MTTPNGTFSVRDENTILQAMLRTVTAGFQQWGLPTPNTAQGSELYLRFRAIARQLTVTESNGVTSVNAQMPDSATGDAAARWLSLLGISQRSPGPSVGNVNVVCTQTTSIPTGAQLVDANNNVYAVTVGGLYSNNTPCQIIANVGGASTNLPNGTSLRWLSAPPYCGPTVTVGAPGGGDGLRGGVDQETLAGAQARMILRLQNAMFGGNWTTFALLGANATPLVQQAFVYPAANGPGTAHVAVCGYASTLLAASNAYNRDIAASVMNSIVVPYITGNVAEYAEVVVTTVANSPTDVAFGLVLPSAPTATPPGPGGGWLDGSPWPLNPTGALNVTSVTNSTTLAVSASAPPIVGASRVAWIDPSTWKLNLATVVAVSGTGPWTITLDTPWPNLFTSYATYGGAYVFPQSANQTTYVASALAAFAGMGPGEKTNAAGLISRALRKPLPASLYPYSLGYQQLDQIAKSDSLVASASYLFRSQTTPALPGSISDPPNIITPRNIGFFPA